MAGEARERCPICGQPVNPAEAETWWRVWTDGSGRREIEGYTHLGKCTDFAHRRYELTEAEKTEIQRMRSEQEGGGDGG